MRLLAATDLSGAAGPLGLLVVVLIGVATVLLIRNMDKRLKRMPRQFAPQADERGTRRPAAPQEPPHGEQTPDR